MQLILTVVTHGGDTVEKVWKVDTHAHAVHILNNIDEIDAQEATAKIVHNKKVLETFILDVLS